MYFLSKQEKGKVNWSVLGHHKGTKGWKAASLCPLIDFVDFLALINLVGLFLDRKMGTNDILVGI